jgi:mannose-6-phosphate isomerase-like protein (cupin superfamily)
VLIINKYTEKRPWGRFERFCKEKCCSVKLIFIKPNEELSLQYHKKRSEFLKIIKGKTIVTLNNKEIEAKANDEFFVPKKMLHKIKAKRTTVIILEISFGKHDENDVIRLQDKYNRK